jgi:hypothetical protein
MKPVQFPKQKADDYPDASRLPRQKPTDEESQAQPDATQPAATDQNPPAQSQTPGSQPN